MSMVRKGVGLSLAWVLAVGGIFFPPGTPTRPSPPQLLAGTAATRLQISERYSQLPLVFEANRGQTDPQVQFLSRGGHHVVFLTPREAVLVLTTPAQAANANSATRGGPLGWPEAGTQTVLRMTFAGASPSVRVAGVEELPGKAHYFLG